MALHFRIESLTSAVMALPTSGPISMNDIINTLVAGKSAPHRLGELYAGGGRVAAGTVGANGAVPSAGAISFRQFYGVGSAPIQRLATWEYHIAPQVVGTTVVTFPAFTVPMNAPIHTDTTIPNNYDTYLSVASRLQLTATVPFEQLAEGFFHSSFEDMSGIVFNGYDTPVSGETYFLSGLTEYDLQNSGFERDKWTPGSTLQLRAVFVPNADAPPGTTMSFNVAYSFAIYNGIGVYSFQ